MARFVSHDTSPDMTSAILALRSDIAYLQVQVSALKLMRLLTKHNFDPSQPRVPAGSPDGGQWTDAGGGYVRVAAGDEEESNRGLFEEFLDPLAGVRQQAFTDGMRDLRRLDPDNIKLNIATDHSRPYVPTSEALNDLAREVEMARESIAKRISSGHALTKHAAEFEYPSQPDFEYIILQILRSASRVVDLPRGRTAYYRRSPNALVIVNPADPHGGTALRPSEGEEYLDKLKRDE